MSDTPKGFSVIRRNYGHWDIVRQSEGRLFRLRGGPGAWRIFDERKDAHLLPVQISNLVFKEQSAAMAWVCAELMQELLTVDGQEPYVMEAWNV